MTVDIKELQELIRQKETLIDRLKKLDEKKKEIKEKIYLKICEDYKSQLQKWQDTILKKSVSLENELSQLGQQRQDILGKSSTLKDELDELNIRHDLGEFSNKDEFKKMISGSEEKLSALSRKAHAIEEQINVYTTLLEKIEDSGGFITEEDTYAKVEKSRPQEKEKVAETLKSAIDDIEEFSDDVPIEELEEEVGIICSSCGTFNDKSANKCKKCGTFFQLTTDDLDEISEVEELDEVGIDDEDIMKCPKCGASNSLEQQYCTECGAELLPLDDLEDI